MTTSRKQPDKDELDLFRDSVKGVRRLPQDRRPPSRARVKPVPRKTREDEERVREELLAPFHDDEIETGDELVFSRPGLQHGLMRKLRRGQYAVQAEIDLHGMTVTEAHVALGKFLDACLSNAVRCIRIIHGKGLSSPGKKPVLKTRVNLWLQRNNDVLAFCSARPNDGGTGAVYVLLKKRR